VSAERQFCLRDTETGDLRRISTLLAIYLNDHLAGSTVGVELSRRAATENRGNAYGPFLERLANEIAEDRRALLRLMETMDIRTDHMKVAAAWSAEKLGRLKFNGRLRGYSPLSRVVELEGLRLGVTGKLAMWRALDNLGNVSGLRESADLPELIARAERQLSGLEDHRLRATAEALSQ
jgi:hypothetical protein